MLIAELLPQGDCLAHAVELYSTGLEKILQEDFVECPLPRLYIQRCCGMQTGTPSKITARGEQPGYSLTLSMCSCCCPPLAYIEGAEKIIITAS